MSIIACWVECSSRNAVLGAMKYVFFIYKNFHSFVHQFFKNSVKIRQQRYWPVIIWFSTYILLRISDFKPALHKNSYIYLLKFIGTFMHFDISINVTMLEISISALTIFLMQIVSFPIHRNSVWNSFMVIEDSTPGTTYTTSPRGTLCTTLPGRELS